MISKVLQIQRKCVRWNCFMDSPVPSAVSPSPLQCS